MSRTEFYDPDQVASWLDQVLAASIADETEIVWLDRRCGWSTRRHRGFLENPRLTVLVRVVEAGRLGWFRTDTADPNLLEGGVRHALTLARLQPKLKKRPLLPKGTHGEPADSTYDEAISDLRPGEARALLQKACDDQERARLSWTDMRLMIANSHGLRRRAATSEATLEVGFGRRPGAGRAAASARFLSELDKDAIRARAAGPHSAAPPGEIPSSAVPVLLAPEASIELLNVLNAFAFSGRSYLDGTSFLNRYRNVQVFDRSFNLRDDGGAPGLPFPFDFEGSIKRPLDLIVKGRPSTPALDQMQGAEAGLAPTAQAVGGQDSLFGNLFLLPGEASEEDLLAAADGGLRIGWLQAECFEPSQLRVRCVASSVRRIRHGRLAEPLPDLVWEESLLGLLAQLRALGRETVIRSMPTTPLGGIAAPPMVLVEGAGFRPLSGPRDDDS